MSNEATTVGVAVVEHNGSYLVGLREGNVPLAGYAEFPGGKCRPRELPRDCAARECLEETGLSIVPVRLLLKRTFDYPHGAVDLHFWLCRLQNATAVAAAHQSYCWVEAGTLKRLQFPEANVPVIAMLVAHA